MQLGEVSGVCCAAGAGGGCRAWRAGSNHSGDWSAVRTEEALSLLVLTGRCAFSSVKGLNAKALAHVHAANECPPRARLATGACPRLRSPR